MCSSYSCFIYILFSMCITHFFKVFYERFYFIYCTPPVGGVLLLLPRGRLPLVLRRPPRRPLIMPLSSYVPCQPMHDWVDIALKLFVDNVDAQHPRFPPQIRPAWAGRT